MVGLIRTFLCSGTCMCTCNACIANSTRPTDSLYRNLPRKANSQEEEKDPGGEPEEDPEAL